MKKAMKIILLAGICGGMAELAWITLVSAVTPVSGMEVARQVSATVLPAMADAAGAVSAGIAIHLLLSILLAAGFIRIVWLPYSRKLSPISLLLVATAALSGVWAINFLIILPVLNPVLVSLMPYAVTLISKILFGIAMGQGLLRADRM